MTMLKCLGHHGAEHDPIEFEGVFTALCPLCAALQSVASKQAEIETFERDAEESQTDLERAEENEKEAKDELVDSKDVSDEIIKGLEARIKELEGKP